MNTTCQALRNTGYQGRSGRRKLLFCFRGAQSQTEVSSAQHSAGWPGGAAPRVHRLRCVHRATQTLEGTFKGQLVPLPCDKRAPMAQPAAQSPECRPEAMQLPRAQLVQCAKPLCLNCSQFTYGWISQRLWVHSQEMLWSTWESANEEGMAIDSCRVTVSPIHFPSYFSYGMEMLGMLAL